MLRAGATEPLRNNSLVGSVRAVAPIGAAVAVGIECS
jgi:hypothetical protein